MLVARWAAALALLASCAHKFDRETHERAKEEVRTEWRTAETAEQRTHENTTAETGRKTTLKARARGVKIGDTTIDQLDLELLDEAVAMHRSEVDAASRSASTAAGEQQRRSERQRDTDTKSNVSWWPPWWLWVVAAVVLFVLLWLLRWRARRLRLS